MSKKIMLNQINFDELNVESIRQEKKKCDSCSKVLSEFALKAHIIFEHENLKKCDQCNANFTSERTLASHLKGHDQRFCYMCDICGVTISSYSKLNEHLRIHTGERPFKCTICDNKFSQSSSLKV